METTRTLKLTLPFPPSVNTYWRRGPHGTYLAPSGRKFRTAALAAIEQQMGDRGSEWGEVAVVIDLYRGDKRSYDVDNYAKGVLDALETSSVLHNDSQVQKLTLNKCEVIKGGKCEVTIITIDPAA